MIRRLKVWVAFLISLLLFSICGNIMWGCLGKTGKQESVKFQQYFAVGEQLYVKNCSNCHQKSGVGLGLLYPPLNTSDFMDKNPEKVICLIKYGIEGELLVNGSHYNKAMPGIPSLTELEIAEISTYLFNSWGRKNGIIETERVSRTIEHCQD
jgi:cytochrome c551